MKKKKGIKKLGTTILNNWRLAVVVIILTAISGYVLSAYGLKKHYITTFDIYVESYDGESSAEKADTAALLFTSPQMFNAINEQLVNRFSYAEFREMLSVERVNNSQLIHAEVDCPTSKDSYLLAEKYLQLMPSVLTEYTDAIGIIVTEPPTEPSEPVFPNETLFTAVGAVIGFIISVIGILIIWRLDNTITATDNLTEQYGVALLGEIIDFDREVDYLGR